MNIISGKFSDPKRHHHGWIRRFRFHGGVELWFGKRWILVEWR